MRANVSARNFSSLTYRKSGRVLIRSEGAEFVSEANTLTFVPAGCDYATEILEGGEMVILHFQIAEGSRNFFDRPTRIAPVDQKRFADIFARAISHSIVGNECACMADAYNLFSEIFKETRLHTPHPSPALVRVKQYMDENFASSELRVSALAARYKTSEAYFRREFKKHYGEAPLEYIKRRRIEMACHLLCTELYSITDVASRSGFDNASYFSLEFKRYMGCSPKEYRTM
jgi:AraC-like DNA-binding protein